MKDREEILDELLVLRCQGGDAGALEMLSRRWHSRVLSHACRLLGSAAAAPDVAQEAWLAIVRGLRRLDDPARFRGWVYRIVANKCSDWIRQEQRRRRLVDQIAPEPTPSPSGERRHADLTRMRSALADLSVERRAILSMFYLEGLSVREIATATSVPVGTVKTRLFHARHHLRKAMED